MVERMLCMHEAQGSIPCSSINFLRFFFFFSCWASYTGGCRNESGGGTLGEVRVV